MTQTQTAPVKHPILRGIGRGTVAATRATIAYSRPKVAAYNHRTALQSWLDNADNLWKTAYTAWWYQYGWEIGADPVDVAYAKVQVERLHRYWHPT